eukprot:COSAG04_NODE_17_length_40288_cov_9.152728_16_plen_313_part_00
MASAALGIQPGTVALMGKASEERVLRQEDLPPLAPSLTAAGVPRLSPSAAGATSDEVSRGSLARAIWAAHWRVCLLVMVPLRLAGDGLRFAGPATLNAMVAWLAEASGSARLWWEPRWLAPSHRGAFYLVAMAAANMARTVLEQHAGNLSSAVNSQINTAVTSEIFSKAMRQKGHGRLASTGKVMNLVGNDAGQLSEWIGTIYKLPASLLSIVLGGWQLLGLLGPAPLLGGVGVLGIFAPLSYLATRHCNFWRDKWFDLRDVRVSQMSECLHAMKLIKSNAWESGLAALVGGTRVRELASCFRYRVVDYLMM